jgi:hypothetical protein
VTGRGPVDAQPGYTLPVFDRIAPAPPPAVIAARIDLHTGPGEVVADLFGRGGWVARAAIDHQRLAVSLESSPLTRMLAEVVLRPPDIRHLDAAIQGLAASPRGDTSLKTWIGDLFATRCATCGRMLVADDIVWSVDDEVGVAGRARPVARSYRCAVCQNQQGGPEQRQAPLDADDLRRVDAAPGVDAVRSILRSRFPDVDGAEGLPDELLALHTPRQLVGLGAILERIEGELRAAPVLAALRLALLHAVLIASRLSSQPGRAATLRVSTGHVRPLSATQFRERNPWLAFEDGVRLVRGFIQRIEGGPTGPVQARVGEDLRSLGEGVATTVLGLGTIGGAAVLRTDVDGYGRAIPMPRIRLVLGQTPLRLNLDRLVAAYHGTAWVLGRDAAALLQVDALAGASLRPAWGEQAARMARTYELVEPTMARDGRVIQLVEGGVEPLVSTVVGGATAGFRLLAARVSDPDDPAPSVVELLPPGGIMPPGPRTRANVGLEPVPGGAGDPDMVAGTGIFSAPERVDHRPFSATDAGRTITDIAVETLKARGEPATYERLLGEILVGLDRAGHLRRLVIPPPGAHNGLPATTAAHPAADPVERLLTLIGDTMGDPAQRRLGELEPDRWWLTAPDDITNAAVPVADRVEWAVFSLLSTAGPLPERSFFDRIASMFGGPDLPEEGLVRACLDAYRSIKSTPDRVVTADDLLKRSEEHTELLAVITEAGHRLGMRTWIGRREQTRRHAGGTLGDLLEAGEQHAFLGSISSAPELADVDAIWYVRGRAAFLFEVEWTAMLGELLLRRHARIPGDDAIVRFLVIAPERTELVRYKLARSVLLRTAIEDGNWHVIKSNHLRTFLAQDPLDLADLEPYLGLDPSIERSAEQMALFG